MDRVFMVIILLALLGTAVELESDVNALEAEVRYLEAELAARPVLATPPGVTFTQADTLTCYPRHSYD